MEGPAGQRSGIRKGKKPTGKVPPGLAANKGKSDEQNAVFGQKMSLKFGIRNLSLGSFGSDGTNGRIGSDDAPAVKMSVGGKAVEEAPKSEDSGTLHRRAGLDDPYAKFQKATKTTQALKISDSLVSRLSNRLSNQFSNQL